MMSATVDAHGGSTSSSGAGRYRRREPIWARTVTLDGGVEMPTVGLGGGIFDGRAEESVLSALKLGYRLVDTAANYNTEDAIGRAVRRSGVPREEMFLVSKAPTAGYTEVRASFERSLEQLMTPYLDLFMLHGAAANGVRDLGSKRHASARRDSWRALAGLRCQGPPPYHRCARAIGVCNHSPRQLRALLDIAKPAVHQMELTPLLQRNATLAFCAEHGIMCQGYGNGGGGWKLWRQRPHLDFLRAPAVLSAAAAHGVQPVQVSLRWSLQRGAAVIPMSAEPAHQAENLRLFHFTLSPHEMAAINSLDEGAAQAKAGTTALTHAQGDQRSVYEFLDPEKIS